MALSPLTGIALCAGVGMLDEGVRLALGFLGCEYRTVCYVEREAFAAAQLATLMEAGCLDAAPVWSDLLTFDGSPWRGKVDCLTAGFPCQPHSVAGKRLGLEDARWIWPDIVRIVGEVRPRYLFLENVPGLAASGGLDACIADLAACGFAAEWGVLSAAAVGAAQQRERIFILAYAGCEHSELQQRPHGAEYPAGHAAVGSTDGLRGAFTRVARSGRTGLEDDGESVANARCVQRGEGHGQGGCDRAEAGRYESDHRAAHGGEELPDASGEGFQGGQLGPALHECGGGAQAHEPVSELCGVFAPGPDSARWPEILANHAHLAPATQPDVRGLVDGMALLVDESRADQLRAIGNGVVALAAACAYVQLARRLS